MQVPFYRHALGREDALPIADVLASPFLTTGAVCKAVEGQLCEYFSVPHATLVNSWTNGALATLLAMGIGRGDEVIVPAMTFIASANVVELTGATTVFADVDPATLLLAPDEVARRVTARTRAVIPVHLYGQMCDIPELRRTLEAHPVHRQNIAIIEDCAHCFEGERDGLKPGHASDAAIFSFYATKNVTCGEGGAVVVRDRGLFQAILEAKLHGMSAIAADRFSGNRYNHWDMLRLGTKANLPDLLAALLPRQIETIDTRLPERWKIASRYRQSFAGGPLRLVVNLQECRRAEHLFTIGVTSRHRDDAIRVLNEAGVSVTVNYRSVPRTTYYRNRYPENADAFPIAAAWGEETLTLPLFPGMTRDEQDYVIDVVKGKVDPLLEAA
jgi:dTDP-4-amino-4,6-dideoxygalactose transaminase